MTKPWHVIIFFVVCIAIGLGIGITAQQLHITDWFTAKQAATTVARNIVTKKPDPITITFVGDIMMDRGVENSVNRNFSGDFNSFLSLIKPELESADITFGNLEGAVGTKGPNVGSAYSFQMNPAILPALKNTGFDIVLFANNHVGDRSVTGFKESLENLRTNNLLFTGAGDTKPAAEQPTIITINGKKIGFLGFTDVGPNWLAATDASPGILLLSDPNLETIIKNAKSQVDNLIISVHWGVEYNPATDRQKKFAHNMIDWGADAIIGSHPHVIQATEWYQGKFIAYSLGNFVFDQYFSADTLRGLMVNMTILNNGQISVDQKIIQLSKQYQPISVRNPVESDYITHTTVAAQTCPSAKEAENDLWLSAVGPDLEIGNYVPKNLVTMTNKIDARGSATCLVSKAADPVAKMFTVMSNAGMKPVMTSGFRSRNTQEDLHDASETTLAAASDPAKYPSVALPGHSEHQLGIAFDMKSGTSDDFSYDGFKNSLEYQWLTDHAAEYGFVNSYQNGNEAITGYIAEPWHWRYVGVDNAKQIIKQNIAPYEFLKNLAN